MPDARTGTGKTAGAMANTMKTVAGFQKCQNSKIPRKAGAMTIF